jgi:hydrogenase/urease accessory protein HupE
MFRLGITHIAEGTDHLLFLLALLLPAPLTAFAGRWAASAGVRRSILQTLRVVTAFTVGHSITLALAAFNVVSFPSRSIEVLIAVSILVSAVHALRPLFPGREAAIAAFFGLVHGLAFAATLSHLALNTWQRISSLLAFNLGIEFMQLLVVAATMPSLILLSRTGAYTALRKRRGTLCRHSLARLDRRALARLAYLLRRNRGARRPSSPMDSCRSFHPQPHVPAFGRSYAGITGTS